MQMLLRTQLELKGFSCVLFMNKYIWTTKNPEFSIREFRIRILPAAGLEPARVNKNAVE